MSNINKERNELDFIKSRDGMHSLMRHRNLPDWYVVEYADEICDMWDEFMKYHGISQEIKTLFQSEIVNFYNTNSPHNLFGQPFYWPDHYMSISVAKAIFEGYQNNGLSFTASGKTMSFEDTKYRFKFDVALDFRIRNESDKSRNIVSIIIYGNEEMVVSASETIYGLPITSNEVATSKIYSKSKEILDSNSKSIYSLVMAKEDIESTLHRGSTLKSESNILELQDEIKTLTKEIRASFKKGLEEVCQSLKDVE